MRRTVFCITLFLLLGIAAFIAVKMLIFDEGIELSYEIAESTPASYPHDNKAEFEIKPSEDNAEANDGREQSAAVPFAVSGQEPKYVLSALETEIDSCLEGLDSSWDVYVERLADGAYASCSNKPPNDTGMVSASIIKIFVMGTVYDQIYKGNIDENDVETDIEKMITVSDNDATNRLIMLLGGGEAESGLDAVNEFIKGIGCGNTRLNRLMLDWEQGLQNYTTGADCARLLRLIYSGDCVSGEYSGKMMTLLKAQQKNEGLTWNIPDYSAVASKPGFISGICVGDVGIVFSDKADYIVCIICNYPKNDYKAKEKISEISKAAYDFFNPDDDDLVRVLDYIPTLYVDLKYAAADNFTGTVIYDYSDAYLRYGTVRKLLSVQNELETLGCSLKIWDAYRSIDAQFKLWEAYPDPVYVADPNTGYSSHSRGNTVDITLVASDGKELEMPSLFDEFSSLGDRDYTDVPQTAKANALLLEEVMTHNGFSGYPGEWWHYTDLTEYPVVDYIISRPD